MNGVTRDQEMNCIEFRRALLVDPRRLCEAALRHAELCGACRSVRARALAFEREIEDALRVPVPESLARALPGPRKMPRPLRRFAIAAGLLLAAAVGALVSIPRADPLVRAGIEFVVYDEARSIVDAGATDWRTIQRAADEMGVSLPERLGAMRYVCLYPLAAGPAHHLLVKTPFGKISLLLIPGHPVAARASGDKYGLKAVVLPASRGSVIVVGDSARSIQRVESLLRIG